MRHIAKTLCAGLTLSLLSLAGCDQIDPLTRPYVWKPTDINRQNIAAMAARPADLVHGRGTARHNATVEAIGVERINTGKPIGLLSATGGPGGGT